MNKIRIMLYVTDVEKNQLFWQENFGATVVESLTLPENFKGEVLALSQEIQLVLFDKDFIAKYSPEVADNVPSLMFYRSDFEALQQKIPSASEITPLPIENFNFSDPEGHYFAVAKA